MSCVILAIHDDCEAVPMSLLFGAITVDISVDVFDRFEDHSELFDALTGLLDSACKLKDKVYNY